MVDFIFQRKCFKIREMAFSSIRDVEKKPCDVIYLHSLDTEYTLKKKGVYAQKQHTLINDLSLTEEELSLGIKKNCKYEIRRAEKEGVVAKTYASPEDFEGSSVLEEFEKTYNAMFAAKNMAYSFNRVMAEAAVKAGQMVVTTSVLSSDANCVVYHAYFVDGNSAVLLYSASTLWLVNDKDKANAIGRMNKYLHWRDMLFFKEKGYARYEWGGISDPERPNGIDKFKAEFGGETVAFYNYFIPQTLLGRIYVFLVRRKEKARKKNVVD